MRVMMTVACAALGFLLVAQVRTTESLGERLETEREEDLARILADLSRESDRLQSELTELRLTLATVESSAESEALALETLQRRLDDLRILAGVAPAEGQGIELVVTDPDRLVTADQLVDVVQELRDAGAEAIAVNGVRLVASSAFTAQRPGAPPAGALEELAAPALPSRTGQLLADRQPLSLPYRIAAIGPGRTMAKALQLPGGAIDTLASVPKVTAVVRTRSRVEVPSRAEPPSFTHGRPVRFETSRDSGPDG